MIKFSAFSKFSNITKSTPKHFTARRLVRPALFSRTFRYFGNHIIGIDLGTTNSSVAILQGGSAKIIENSEGQRTTPSVVAFTKDGQKIVGLPAKRQSVINPKSTFYATKRLIGRKYDDPDTQKDKKTVPFTIARGTNGEAWVSDEKNVKYSPQQIGAFILEKLKSTAETYLGEPVKNAVITVPAYFNDAQRTATKQAGAIAGLTVERVINEPTAAAVAYGIDKSGGQKHIAVYDLGGGTFDVSILHFDDGVFEVKATNGNTSLGGEDADLLVVKYLAEEFKKKNGIDLMKDASALQRLKDAAERAKQELSTTTATDVKLPFITMSHGGVALHMDFKLTRAKLEFLVADLIARTREPVEKCLKDSTLTKSEIDEVVLVGGMTRMPAVRRAVKEMFGKEPVQRVNPDEVVALGAATQAGVMMGKIDDIVLLDVSPLTLGIETQGGISTPIIPRNTTIPSKKEKVFSTAADNQPQVQIKVLQGERTMSKDNNSLGEFVLDGIPPAPRGVPQIKVIFDIDANGILHVTASDKTTGREKKIKVKHSGGLSEEEINRMKETAKKFEEEDKRQNKLIQSKNEAESEVDRAEKSLNEHKSKLSTDLVHNIENKIRDLRQAIEKPDVTVEELNDKISAMKTEVMKIGPELSSQQASKENVSKEGEKKESASKKTVDAEYEENSKK